jgi:hypothetical protein
VGLTIGGRAVLKRALLRMAAGSVYKSQEDLSQGAMRLTLHLARREAIEKNLFAEDELEAEVRGLPPMWATLYLEPSGSISREELVDLGISLYSGIGDHKRVFSHEEDFWAEDFELILPPATPGTFHWLLNDLYEGRLSRIFADCYGHYSVDGVSGREIAATALTSGLRGTPTLSMERSSRM